MSHENLQNLNVIKELRLRRWARTHYVPASERSSNWHPVVLQEMLIRDQEYQEKVHEMNSMTSPFVPLAPMPINIIHPAHKQQNEPKILELLQDINAIKKIESSGQI